MKTKCVKSKTKCTMKKCEIIIETSVIGKDYGSVIETAKSLVKRIGKHFIDGITYTVDRSKIVVA